MMIEKTVLDYLTEKLNVPVYMEVPEKMDDSFVVIEKTGSDRVNRIYSALVAIQSYASTLYKAASLNEEVKEAMDDFAELEEVGSCRLNGDYNYTSTTTKQYRYQAVFEITHY